jgi:hypothetical protein
MTFEQRSLFDRWNDDAEIFQNKQQYEYNIYPLGKLSKNQINKGNNILNNIRDIINTSNDKEQLINLSNIFYSTIPHLSQYIIIIDNNNILNEKYNLINYMFNN